MYMLALRVIKRLSKMLGVKNPYHSSNFEFWISNLESRAGKMTLSESHAGKVTLLNLESTSNFHDPTKTAAHGMCKDYPNNFPCDYYHKSEYKHRVWNNIRQVKTPKPQSLSIFDGNGNGAIGFSIYNVHASETNDNKLEYVKVIWLAFIIYLLQVSYLLFSRSHSWF